MLDILNLTGAPRTAVPGRSRTLATQRGRAVVAVGTVPSGGPHLPVGIGPRRGPRSPKWPPPKWPPR